jgi:hypothetical protein
MKRPVNLDRESVARIRSPWRYSGLPLNLEFLHLRSASSRRPAVVLAMLLAGTWTLAAASPAAWSQTTLVPAGSVWKYLDDGSDQGVAWREPGFDDDGWSEGPAQLGYGDGDEATVVSFGPNSSYKYVTTYFRHAFTVADPSQYDFLTIKLVRDDGAAVYLNGVEIVRTNLSTAPVEYETFASATVGGADESAINEYPITADQLVIGENLLAVEIHQVNRTSSDISFDLELVSGLGDLSLVRKRPYLVFSGDPLRMRLHWQLYMALPCTLSWGLDTDYALGSVVTGEYGIDHQHLYDFTSLSPGQQYYYRVAAGSEVCLGSFMAAPDSSANNLKFMVYGDTRTYPQDHDAVAAGMVATMAADPAFQSIILSVGDLVSDGDFEEYWDSEFFGPALPHVAELLGNAPLQVSMGNHEGDGELFQKYFPYPYVADRYWSFDYGPAHFVCIDQYTDPLSGSAQLAWLDGDLAGTAKPWRFIYLHEPGWSADSGHENDLDVQQYIQPLCEMYGVAIVFGGHNHYYARAVVNGVQHITTGGGGAPLYVPNLSYPNVVAGASAHHYCKVEITGHSLEFQAVTPEGEVLDAFSLESLVGVGPDGPSAPVRLGAAYPNPFNPGTIIPFSLSAPQTVSVAIYDLKGHLVAHLTAAEYPSGTHEVSWDGLDLRGRAVSSGTYVVRFETPDGSMSHKLMLVR